MNAESIPSALRLLLDEQNPAADALLLEALPAMNRTAQAAALDVLLKRNRPAALAALVGRFPELDAGLKRLVVPRMAALHSGVRMALTSPSLEVRLAAIQTIVSADDARSAYLLADALKGRCPKTRESAGQALRELTARNLDHSKVGAKPLRPSDHADRAACTKALADALGTAVEAWELHFQIPVLEAALWLGDRTRHAVDGKLEDSHSKLVHALNDLFAGASDPRLVGSLLRGLARSTIRTSAARTLGRAQGMSFYNGLFREMWLVADPEIERGCRWVQDTHSTPDWTDRITSLPDHLVDPAIRWVDGYGGTPQRRLEMLREMINTDREAIRRAVLWRMVENEAPEAEEILNLLAVRVGDPVAELASHELFRRKNRASQTGEVRAGGQAGIQTDSAFEDFFDSVDASIDAAPGIANGPGANRAALANRLRVKLQAGSASERVKALRLISAWSLHKETAECVHACARHSDSAVRAAAVSVLAGLTDAVSARILREALHDSDPRVQANAVESLDKLNVKDGVPALAAKLESSHQRVRANAIKALLRMDLRRAGEALIEMLHHPLRGHRLSGLWVVERLQLRTVLHRIRNLSLRDPDPKVRGRAARLFRELAGAGGMDFLSGQGTDEELLAAENET